jgi:nicotinamide riboside transporter PnuC
MTWIITIAALVGTIANIKRHRWCFAVWLVTNCAWAAVDYGAGLYSQAALMAVYAGLSVWGWCSWKQIEARG